MRREGNEAPANMGGALSSGMLSRSMTRQILGLQCWAFTVDEVLLGEVLNENLGDYMSLGMFNHHITAKTTSTHGVVRGATLGYLAHMLDEGYMGIGDVYGNEFVPWDCGVTEAMSRVRRQWPDEAPVYENIRDIAWLNNTPRGNDFAAATRNKSRKR